MKNLGRICEWALRGIVTVVAIVVLVSALRSDNTEMNDNRPQQTAKKATAAPITLKTSGQAILDILPDGASTSYDEFKKHAGDDVARLLSWAQPKTITRKGRHVIVDSAAPASTTAGGVTISLGSRVEFDVGSGSGLSAQNITGVKVTKGSIGPFPIRKASMTVQPNGNIKVQGAVELSSWLPYWWFDVTLGPDGQPLP